MPKKKTCCRSVFLFLYALFDLLVFSWWQNILLPFAGIPKTGKRTHSHCSITLIQEEQHRESMAPPQW
ncbi:uncharacterized protein J3R85_017113 [Psidium guajava]|nr:uncharacterized protein J3R85_017113 [Psidium guajava]